jgi:nicotinamidase-related amidase
MTAQDDLKRAFEEGTVAHLAVDLQRLYCDVAFANEKFEPSARRGEKLAGLIDQFSACSRPAAAQVWVYHAMGNDDCKTLCVTARQQGDLVIGKPGLSAFDRTELGYRLHASGITTVLVTGAFKEQCVLQTALDAQRLGYNTILVDDLAIWSPDANASWHEKGLSKKLKTHTQAMLDRHGVTSMRSADILALL